MYGENYIFGTIVKLRALASTAIVLMFMINTKVPGQKYILLYDHIMKVETYAVLDHVITKHNENII